VILLGVISILVGALAGWFTLRLLRNGRFVDDFKFATQNNPEAVGSWIGAATLAANSALLIVCGLYLVFR
jgi:hypothetical protein